VLYDAVRYLASLPTSHGERDVPGIAQNPTQMRNLCRLLRPVMMLVRSSALFRIDAGTALYLVKTVEAIDVVSNLSSFSCARYTSAISLTSRTDYKLRHFSLADASLLPPKIHSRVGDAVAES
jgi:hypothetical protein